MDGKEVEEATLRKMTDLLAHRGPDGEGVWRDGSVGLGHRRLAIIDLSEAGRQPMANEDGTVVVTYNGELYNHLELRAELVKAGHQFRSLCDTETIVHAYEEWGQNCLVRFNGIFAFAISDGRKRRLFLACDRAGVKPLYYYRDAKHFVFASEVKAILAEINVAVCLPALDEYFTFQNLVTDRTLFDGVLLLPAGSWMMVELEGRANIPHRYWDVPVGEPLQISSEEAEEELGRLLQQAVKRQLMSDVPLGGYLSGGIDSGFVVAAARPQLDSLRTFTAGFDVTGAVGRETRFDERPQAEELARHYGTEHYEVVLNAGSMRAVLPEVIWHQEDLRNGQCYPRYYVARLASKFVKVILSGGGGDELFGGYPWRYYRGLYGATTDDYYKGYYRFWQRLVPDDEKRLFFRPEIWGALRRHESFADFGRVLQRLPVQTAEERIFASMYFDFKTFLRGLLINEDKLSMAHGLEARVPFLDNDLLDFAWRLPMRFKLGTLTPTPEQVLEAEKGTLQTQDGKLILRQVAKGILPPSAGERIKQGFSPPDATWFGGDGLAYIWDTLMAPTARIYGFVNVGYVRRKLEEHRDAFNHRLLIWSLLSFEWWLRRFM